MSIVWGAVDAPSEFLGFFGDGNDGNATISGGTTTLTTDKYYNNLTVEAGAVLDTDGFRVFVRGTLTLNGIISCDGNNGFGGGPVAGGDPKGSGTMGQGVSGGEGGDTDTFSGNPGANIANGLGGDGGAGGDGGFSGGAGGVVTTPTDLAGGTIVYKDLMRALEGRDMSGTVIDGGAGGGGGGGEFVDNGGGGGGGAGICAVYARDVTGSGSITAIGGNGGESAGGSSGGGGGGGGGVVILFSRNPESITTSAAGGTGGAGGNFGEDGEDGNTGRVFLLTLN